VKKVPKIWNYCLVNIKLLKGILRFYEMGDDGLNLKICEVAGSFIERTKDKEILVVSHFDTDGISSATIAIKALRRMDRTFSVKIVKSLEREFILGLPKDKVILFLDLASSSFSHMEDAGLSDVFILDHHEVSSEVPSFVNIVNSQLHDKEKLSGAGITYLFFKEIDEENIDSSKIAVLGMIGDRMEKEIEKITNGIVSDGEIVKKRGPLIYPSTRPLNRTLEFCSSPYIPEVTGDIRGVLELLREAGLGLPNGGYPSLLDLDEEEMGKLTTAIMLRNPKVKHEELIGDIFLIKMFNKLEDARELSAMINACSRSGDSELAIRVLLEIPNAKKDAEKVHVKHKQFIVAGLKYVKETHDKIEGEGFILINGGEELKDTIAGTVGSILSSSNIYSDGTAIITTAYYEDKVKVSIRRCGREGDNLREILASIISKFDGEVGGHEFAAGGIIKQSQEDEFIHEVRMFFEPEVVEGEKKKKVEAKEKVELAVKNGEVEQSVDVKEDSPEDFDVWGKKKVVEEEKVEAVEKVMEDPAEKNDIVEPLVEKGSIVVEQSIPLGQTQL
jgi:single-stranded-DNA-specific exonuclease